MPRHGWALDRPARISIGLVFLVLSIAAVSAIATYQLAWPIKRVTEAVRRFGNDPRLLPVPEIGPQELCAAVGPFNAMQGQIQRFVKDRTSMLAAISHDLRTPLTRMRLRAEFVGDEERRKRLFRDVDAMQVVIDSTVAFFRDDFEDEEITVHCEMRRLYVIVRDRGPGIPANEAERVFSPFYRLGRPRNRTTGGGRLALRLARAAIRAHGGDIALRNRPDGGLKVTVTLPSP